MNNGPAKDLPIVKPYLEKKGKPAEMCGNSKYWTPTELKNQIGVLVKDSVECDGFVCNVEFMVNDIGSDTNDFWFLLVNSGYGETPDGNNVYEFEQFCSFYRCDSENGCWTEDTEIYDDKATTVFESIFVSAKFLNDSVVFVLSSGKDGNVYQNITEKLSTEINGDGEFVATYDKLRDTVINLSVLGRPYYMDAHYT